MRLALVHDGLVVNVVEASDDFAPDEGLRAVPAQQAGPGWAFDGRVFSPPGGAHPPPDAVTTFQAREAMRRSPVLPGRNLLDAFNEFVEAQRLEQPSIALAWEYEINVGRNGTVVQALKAGLELDDAALDALFVLAASIAP